MLALSPTSLCIPLFYFCVLDYTYDLFFTKCFQSSRKILRKFIFFFFVLFKAFIAFFSWAPSFHIFSCSRILCLLQVLFTTKMVYNENHHTHIIQRIASNGNGKKYIYHMEISCAAVNFVPSNTIHMK